MILPLVHEVTHVHWSHPAFERITRLALNRAGLVFPENRRESTESAVRRGMARVGISDPNEMAERVSTDGTAYSALLTELTIGETYFFRDPAQWELVRTTIAPDLLRQHEGGLGVRAWSAGCASGEEAYTLSIVLKEAGCVHPTIIGSDLCEHRLSRAERAVYTKWSMRGIDVVQRDRYFRENSQYFHLLPEYRDVRFRALNLAGVNYGMPGQELSELDLILCRNVLIYIEQPVVDAIFVRLVDALREGGWLMIAASDPQPSPDLPLEVVVTEAGLLFRKRSIVRSHIAEAHSPPIVVRPSPPVPTASRGVQTRPVTADRAPVAPASAPSLSGDLATWIGLARANANKGNLTAAADACAEGLARHPEATELYVVQSMVAASAGNFRAAADAARRALYIDRSLAVAHIALGTALLQADQMSDADRALRAAERMLSTVPPNAGVPAADGATAIELLNAVRAHRAMIEMRVANAL